MTRGWLVLLGAIAVVLGCNGISDYEVACQEALLHLEDCCTRISIDGPSADSLCSEEQADLARCLRDQSCGALEQAGACSVANWRAPADCADAGLCPPLPSCQ